MKTREIIKDDFYRHTGNRTFISFLSAYFHIPECKFMFWFRCSAKYSKIRMKNCIYWFVYLLVNSRLTHYRIKYGINIPPATNIGNGFAVIHYGGIVINGRATIGSNCNILNGVTIGSKTTDTSVATIGNGCYIGPGVKIIGAVTIGDNVAIGANAVVTKDIPDNAVVVGIPGKIISFKGAAENINNKI